MIPKEFSPATLKPTTSKADIFAAKGDRVLQPGETPFERQNRYLKALHETSLYLINELDGKELLQNILQQAASLTDTAHGYIYLLEDNGTNMQMKVGMGFLKSQLGRRVKIGEGMGGRVWENEKPILVKDYRAWPGRLADKVLDGLHGIVGIPLKSDDQVLGVIGLAHVDAKRSFNAEDIQMLERFAALATIALQKARLYADVRHELTERKRTETRYLNLLESSPDPIVVYDMKGVATYVNPAFEQTFSMAREEILGKQIDFVPEENWAETKAAIQRMLSGKKIKLFETRRLTKDGRILDVQLSSTLYPGADGKPAGNIVTLRDISAQKKTEKELQKYHDHLEDLVAERTAELAAANLKLEKEIEERKKAEEVLRIREKELEAQSHHLEEVNTALRVLIKQREDDKNELSHNVLANVRELVRPYLEKLQKGPLDTSQKTLVSILTSNLDNIVSPFLGKLASRYVNLTPMEIRVANLVKEGRTNKEIAGLLMLAKNTVLFHRHNIRTKLDLRNKKINLRSHLLSMDQ